jgi:serine acetyltransferase
MSLSDLVTLLRWDFLMNRGYSFDHLRAKMLLVEVRLEQYIFQKSVRHPNRTLKILWYLARFLGAVYQWFFFNANIPGSVKIGRGLRLPHPQNLTIASQAVIGEFCVIYQDVNIVWNGFKPVITDSPKIGDRVLIGTGAIVVGDIEIGDDVLIGAGAIVPKPVPNQSRVLNPPANISPRPISDDGIEAGTDEHLRDLYAIWR